MKIYAVIPAFNEAHTLADIVSGVCEQVEHVIVVDDGSNDGTQACLEPLPQKVTLLRNDKNLGKGLALWRGFEYALEAGASHIVTLDADGQHRSSDIPRLLGRLDDQQESVIIGERRINRQSTPKLRRFANAFADFWISLAAGERIFDSQSGFRVYPSSLLGNPDALKQNSGGFAFETELLIISVYKGYKLQYVPIESLYQQNARPSHYRAIHDTIQIVLVVSRILLNPRLSIPRLRRLLRRQPQNRRITQTHL